MGTTAEEKKTGDRREAAKKAAAHAKKIVVKKAASKKAAPKKAAPKKAAPKKAAPKKAAPKKAAPKKAASKKAAPKKEALIAPPLKKLESREVIYLDTAEVTADDRVRQDLGEINDLASSISRLGQIQPITVFRSGGKIVLEAGERRLRACTQLGIQVAAIFVDPAKEDVRLDRQLDENFKRKDFDVLEAADGLQRRKRIYESLHPETKHGATGGGVRGVGTKSKKELAGGAEPAPRFTLVAADQLGFSERKIQELLAIHQLPKKYKRKIEAAATTSERNQVARECIKQVRQDRKKKALAEAAKRNKQMKIGDKPSGPPIVIHHGDNRKFMIGEELFEVVLTDPPYDREKSSIAHAARAAITPEKHSWDRLDVGWVLKAAPLLTKGGHLITFCPIEAVGAYELAIKEAGLEYRGAMLWIKSNPAPMHRTGYASAVEALVWAVKPGAVPWFNPEAQKAGASSWNVFQGPGVPGSDKDRLHPTQKPEWLIDRLLETHASPELEHRVIDPFAGSGTTAVVAKRRGLACTAIEIDDEYVKSIKLRVDAV